MRDLMIYLILAAIGFVIGTKTREIKERLSWTSKIQTAAILVLVFAMGSRMGANDEVIENLGKIGFTALVMTLVVMGFSILGVFLTRKVLKINRYGYLESQMDSQTDESSVADDGQGRGIDRMTLSIIIAVICGLLFGYLVADKIFADMVFFDYCAGKAINLGLCVLLFFVGLDLGHDETLKDNVKKAGMRVFVFPFVNIVFSMLGAGFCGLFLPISAREAFSVGAGLGWYSLAPGIIMEAGYVTTSAISFMHNVSRELLSIIFIPPIAKKIGYIESTAMPGAAAMDVVLPIVERSTNANVAIYSFVSGLILSLAVPILVPIVIGL